MKKKPGIKMALVGLGYWGKNILRNLYELGVLNTVCDSTLGISLFNNFSVDVSKKK